MQILTNTQIYCSTLAAFNALVETQCYYYKFVETTTAGGLPAYEYTVTFSGTHRDLGIPVILKVLCGRAYMNDSASIAAYIQKQDDIIALVDDSLSGRGKTLTEDALVTTGTGFSILDTTVTSLG